MFLLCVKFRRSYAMMVRIVTAFVFLAIANNAMAETKVSCPSSITLNGMKMDLTLSAPIIVDKASNAVLGRSRIDLTFTAQDRDILWQKKLYHNGSWVGPIVSIENRKGIPLLKSLPHVTQQFIEPEMLKKGSSDQMGGSFYDVDFAKLAQKNIYKFRVKANITPMNIESFYHLTGIVNTYIGDKNVWQEKAHLCLNVDWQYGHLPIEKAKEEDENFKKEEKQSTLLGAFFKALMQ